MERITIRVSEEHAASLKKIAATEARSSATQGGLMLGNGIDSYFAAKATQKLQNSKPASFQ